MNIHHFFHHLHIAISSIFGLVAFVLLIRSIIGWFLASKFTKHDLLLSKSYLILLYLSLILGFFMFFILPQDHTNITISVEQIQKKASLRFWAVEHLYFMTFALILSQIGSLFITKSISDKNKFAYSIFYNGVAILITILSIIFYLAYR